MKNAPVHEHRQLCGAKTRSGKPCQNAPIAGAKRCKFHGGKSLGGIASPTYVHGRRSKFIPQRLHARYHEALEDKELVSLRDDIALVEARLADVLLRVDTGESGSAWLGVQSSLVEFELTQNPIALSVLRQSIARGLSDYAAWEEVKQILEQRRRLVGDERKHVLETGRFITIEQIMLWVGALANEIRSVVMQAVEDEQLRRRLLSGIQGAFTRLANFSQPASRALPQPGSANGIRESEVEISGQAT